MHQAPCLLDRHKAGLIDFQQNNVYRRAPGDWQCNSSWRKPAKPIKLGIEGGIRQLATLTRLFREQAFHDRQARRRAEDLARRRESLVFEDDVYLDHET